MLPGTLQVFAVTQHGLPLAVVTETAGLEHGRVAQAIQAVQQIGAARHGMIRRQTGAQGLQQVFLHQAVLGGAQRIGTRKQRTDFLECLRGCLGNVFEVEGGQVDLAGEPLRGFGIVEPGLQKAAGGAGTGVGSRIQEQETEAQRNAGQAQHATELTAAQHADTHPAARCGCRAASHRVRPGSGPDEPAQRRGARL